MIYFTSDWHFCHKNIITYCNRPFESVDQMNDTIINNINSVVSEQDIIYHLGDVGFADIKKLYALRQRIKCKRIYNIWGNHDGKLRRDISKGYADFFVKCSDYFELQEYGIQFVLCHYPMLSWNRQNHGSIMLHGHTHQSNRVTEVYDIAIPNLINVGVDAWDYYPVSVNRIIEYRDINKILKVSNDLRKVNNG
jgi:calcineurin-like phosphoesterase family protein